MKFRLNFVRFQNFVSEKDSRPQGWLIHPLPCQLQPDFKDKFKFSTYVRLSHTVRITLILPLYT